MKNLLRFFSVLFLLVVILHIVCFKSLDKTPYQQTGFYEKQIAAINNADFKYNLSDKCIEVGWSKINLLPPFTTPIAIDANRGGKHFEGIHDSIYVRAFIFRQQGKKIAFVSADLLIIPPSVTKIFDTLLVKQGFDSKNIFFTATHTHTSLGAWYNSYVGEKFAGKYDDRVPKFIAEKITDAILDAEKKCSPSKIGYAEFPTHQLVFNRLLTQMAHLPDTLGEIDSLIRIVKIENDKEQRAAIITFAAHNTVFNESLMKLSADWSGMMMHKLEEEGVINFASFSAGAVGSMGPFEFSKVQEEEAKYMCDGVGKIVSEKFDSIKTGVVSPIRMIHLPLYLREPNLRVADNFVLRPWLFKKLFGEEKTFINFFQLGNIVFTGMPCDFSGELVNEIDSAADIRHLKFIPTSFNGSYIGYITDDRHYSLRTYETRTMNWFGYGNGNYLCEVAGRVFLKLE